MNMNYSTDLSAVAFHQYSIIDRENSEAYAILTIQDNTPVVFGLDLCIKDKDQANDDFDEYLCDLRIYEPEFYGEIAQAIASEMIDFTSIKFVYCQSFQAPFNTKESKGSINDLYGRMFDNTKFSHLFSLTRVD